MELHFGFLERAPLEVSSICSNLCSDATTKPLPRHDCAIILATVKYAREDPVALASRLTASFVVVMNPVGQVLLTEAVGGPDGKKLRRTDYNIRRETFPETEKRMIEVSYHVAQMIRD